MRGIDPERRIDDAATATAALDHADELIDSDPRRAISIAGVFFGDADTDTAVRARRIAAYAARELHQIDESTEHFEAALALTTRGTDEAARIELSLAGNHALAGRFASGHSVLDRLDACGGLAGERHLIAIQRASLFHIEDKLDDAVAVFQELLDGPVELTPDLRAHVLGNLGSSLMQLGRFNEGHTALDDSLAAYEGAGLVRPQLDVLSNLALCEAWSMHLPHALALFAEAKELAASLGVDDGIARLDEARALVQAGLGHEALAAAASALAHFEGGGTSAWVGEAHLVRALALLLVDDADGAAQAARDSHMAFRGQGREVSAVLASKLEALLALRSTDGSGFPEANRTADRLRELGYRIDAQELDLAIAMAAVTHTDLATAAGAARRVAEGPGATPAARVRREAALGLLAMLDGDAAVALQHFEHGASVLDEYRVTLGATELRAHSSAIGRDLMTLALRAVLRGGDPWLIWQWSERMRASTLDVRPDTAAHSPELADALGALRAANAQSRSGEDRMRLVAAEQRVNDLLRTHTPEPTRMNDSGSVAPVAGSATFVELDGRLSRIDVGPDGSPRVVADVANIADVESALHTVQATWRRWLRHRGGTAAEAVAETLAADIATLDECLQLAPQADDLLVVVSESLHGVPWPALPSLASRNVSATPSASIVARPAASPNRRVAAVAGPGLAHADEEVLGIAPLWPDAMYLSANESSADRVIAALQGCGVAHFAAHGTPRIDNPMFSSLELADGPLTVVDLEGLSDPPQVAILSACDAGRTAVVGGNETLGMVAALLSVGCATVIAPVLPVADAACAPVMIELHRRLQQGDRPSEALRRAVDGFPAGSAEQMVGLSFVCFGRG